MKIVLPPDMELPASPLLQPEATMSSSMCMLENIALFPSATLVHVNMYIPNNVTIYEFLLLKYILDNNYVIIRSQLMVSLYNAKMPFMYFVKVTGNDYQS